MDTERTRRLAKQVLGAAHTFESILLFDAANAIEELLDKQVNDEDFKAMEQRALRAERELDSERELSENRLIILQDIRTALGLGTAYWVTDLPKQAAACRDADRKRADDYLASLDRIKREKDRVWDELQESQAKLFKANEQLSRLRAILGEGEE